MKHVGSAARGRSFGRYRLLVTGFGAFPGARTNPTIAILEQLKRSRARLARLGIDLHSAVVPVVYAEIAGTLQAAVDESRPDGVLHLGLASRRKALCVETRAINRAGPLHPDASGRRPAGQILAAGAPLSLPASYPVHQILAAIRRGGLAARRSIDAGDYVCNATLYRSLLAGTAPQVGFLHVPGTRTLWRSTLGTGSARPTNEMLVRAVLAAILLMARQRHAPSPAAADAPMAPPEDAAPADR